MVAVIVPTVELVIPVDTSVSITMSPESDSEPVVPGAGRAKLALLSAASMIVPPLRDSAFMPV